MVNPLERSRNSSEWDSIHQLPLLSDPASTRIVVRCLIRWNPPSPPICPPSLPQLCNSWPATVGRVPTNKQKQFHLHFSHHHPSILFYPMQRLSYISSHLHQMNAPQFDIFNSVFRIQLFRSFLSNALGCRFNSWPSSFPEERGGELKGSSNHRSSRPNQPEQSIRS